MTAADAAVLCFSVIPRSTMTLVSSTLETAQWRLQQIVCRLGFAARSNRPTTFRVRGENVLMRPDTNDLRVAWASLGGEFKPVFAARPVLKHYFIIDAGGYIGTSAIALARRYPDALIVSIEPDRENFASLVHNTRTFPNVVAIHAALVPSEGDVTLFDRGTGPWGFTTVADPEDAPDATVRGQVPGVTIDGLLKRFDKNGIDILKLDIEGGEHALLNEKPAWLSKTDVIYTELHDRIVPGCSATYSRATYGRDNRPVGWGSEKVLSITR
jgi:FkbM family methyltransferase